ncbi:MAG: hypothetical protein ACTHLT_05635 [Devosia sp.]
MSEYEIQPDIVSRARTLMEQMRRYNMQASADAETLVERRSLELLVSRLIDEARARNHPLTTEPADFWRSWVVFCNGNIRVEEDTVRTPTRAPSPPGRALPTAVSELAPFSPIAAAGQEANPEPAGSGVLLSEARRLYLEQRRTSDGDGRAEEDAGIVLDFLVDFLGDRPMTSLGEGDFMRVENALPDVPHPTGVPGTHRGTLFCRWQYAEEHGWAGLRRVSRTRLKNGWHRCLHSFFAWARKKGLYNGPDYAFTLVSAGNAGEQQRDAWQPAEIIKLFSLPLFTGCQSAAWHWEPGNAFVQSHLYWAYLLIFFAGVRPSEIGRTRTSNFAFIEGVWYLDYRSKSERA